MAKNYQGRVLQWIMSSGIFEDGEIVYCFNEDEEMFRVQSRRLIFGVDQFNFPLKSKSKFRILQ